MQTNQSLQEQDVGHEVHTGAVLIGSLLSLAGPQVQPAGHGISIPVDVRTSTNTVNSVGFVI